MLTVPRESSMMLEGWFETDKGMEPFLLEDQGSFVEAIKEMARYDADFGSTDMEVEWNGEDATKAAYDTVEEIHDQTEKEGCKYYIRDKVRGYGVVENQYWATREEAEKAALLHSGQTGGDYVVEVTNR